MAVEVHARKLAQSWQYDFKLPDKPRERKGGYQTKAHALMAGRQRLEAVLSGAQSTTLAEAYGLYVGGTPLKDRTRDRYADLWKDVEPELGHMFVEEVTTKVMDAFKGRLRPGISPNKHLALIKASLRFAWKRELLSHVPYVPMEPRERKEQAWYTQEERDRLLDGIFETHPQWYLFFYLTCRLGLRRGEVYALSRDRVLSNRNELVIDRQVQRGTKSRPATLSTRKNKAAYTLKVGQDVLDAIRWHVDQGYAGEEFLFTRDGDFPRYVDSYKGALRTVQRRLGLPELGHHAIGRHSVGSQAGAAGNTIKAIQAQLGHKSDQSTMRYIHLANGQQLAVLDGLKPAQAPHLRDASQPRVNAG